MHSIETYPHTPPICHNLKISEFCQYIFKHKFAGDCGRGSECDRPLTRYHYSFDPNHNNLILFFYQQALTISLQKL